jgi:DNA-binding LytR/AlgR family response regulator
MPPLQILIIEDELLTAQDIKETLEKAGHSVVATARNTHEALTALKRQVPDIALVDIHLGDDRADGISIVKEILSYHYLPIIYLTAHSEHPTFLRAKETSPAAYLLKPFRHRELALQVELAYHHFQANRKGVLHPAAAEDLYLPINRGYEKVRKSDIVYIHAEGSYINLHLHNQEKVPIVTMYLGYLEQFLPTPNFYRATRSIIVNLDYLERIEGTEVHLRYNGRKSFTIPDSTRRELLSKIPLVRTPKNRAGDDAA